MLPEKEPISTFPADILSVSVDALTAPITFDRFTSPNPGSLEFMDASAFESVFKASHVLAVEVHERVLELLRELVQIFLDALHFLAVIKRIAVEARKVEIHNSHYSSLPFSMIFETE